MLLKTPQCYLRERGSRFGWPNYQHVALIMPELAEEAENKLKKEVGLCYS